jgi:acyl-coenzyme A thioesterase PaaI-like protein
VDVGDEDRPATRHILRELGFSMVRAGDELHGRARLTPEMWVPATSSLRTSILAAWTDHAAGLLAVDVLAPRVPVTLELDVHLHQPAPGTGTVHAVARAVKAGRSVVVLTVDFTGDAGEPLAMGTGSFMAAPDPELLMPPEHLALALALSDDDSVDDDGAGRRLAVPLAERAGCERRAPGLAVIPRTEDGLNSSNTLNGGLVALAVEEAALSLTPGTTLSSMAMRYLRPVRIGPAVAQASVRAGLGRVEVRDAGSADRLAVVATTRAFGRDEHVPRE